MSAHDASTKCSCCMTRRAMLRGGVAGLAGLVLPGCGGEDGDDVPRAPGGTGVVSGSTLTIDLANAANAPLLSVGGAVLIAVPGDLLIVVRTAAASAIALSAYCTHSGCVVGVGQGLVRCPCHGSRFDLGGTVLQGPAVDPLPSYPTSLVGQTITVGLA